MFNLEKAIAEWRRQMLAAGIKAPVPLEELESHLRDEIDQLVQSGTSEEQAFALAVQNVGKGGELKTEFARGAAQWELKWPPFLRLIISTGLLFLVGGMVLLKKGRFSEITSAEQISSLAAVGVFYLLATSGFWGRKFFPVIHNRRKRVAIGVAGLLVVVALWATLFLAFAPHNMGRHWVALFSAFLVPCGALIGLVSGLERAVYKQMGTTGS